MSKRKKKIPTIIKDTREQCGYNFIFAKKKKIARVISHKLNYGDYSLFGFENEIIIERKRIGELFGSFGSDRERFMREVEGMSTAPHKFLLVEGSFLDLIEYIPKKGQKVTVKTVVGTLISLMLKHNMKVVFADNPDYAEKLAFRILIKFFEYRQKGGLNV